MDNNNGENRLESLSQGNLDLLREADRCNGFRMLTGEEIKNLFRDVWTNPILPYRPEGNDQEIIDSLDSTGYYVVP